MKKKFIIAIFIIILLLAGLVTSYIDSARVRNGVEPKFAIKITSYDGNKITYWGLGYKVIRYPAVSPKESFKSSLGVKYGSWFIKYELSNYDVLDVELLMDEKTAQDILDEYMKNDGYEMSDRMGSIITYKNEVGNEKRVHFSVNKYYSIWEWI